MRYLDGISQCRFQIIARRYNKAFLSEQCKEIEENSGRGRLEIASKKARIFQKTSTSDSLTTLKSLTVWIMTN